MLSGAYRRILPASLALVLLGAGGAVLLVMTTYPVLWARWAFFLCLTAAVTGLSMPIFAYLHHRFPARRPATERTVLREGLWVGLYVGILAWLQLGRVLTPLSAFFPAVALIFLEALLLFNEQHRKSP
ncbi:MAG: hypothetical protein GXO56_07845 [Chloroflexi bacterium]|nr:hypothetical protein [Chloroflexota bacterium]